jgi:hypothetical protein
VIDDRHDVGHALAGPCPARQNVRLALLGFPNRFRLVRVEQKLFARMIRIRFVDLEDLLALGMQRAVRDEVVDRSASQKCRIQLEERFGPQRAVIQGAIDHRLNARVGDLDEAARVASVIFDEAITEIKDIHRKSSSNPQ